MPKRGPRMPLEQPEALEQWPDVDEASLPADKREAFAQRKLAIRLKLEQGWGHRQIEKETGISPSSLTRLYKRCISKHPDGGIFGFRGLIQGVHVVETGRRKPPKRLNANKGGDRGMFRQLLKQYPRLKDFIHDRVLHSQRIGRALNQTDLYTIWKQECRNCGITDSDYPFTRRDQGRVSFFKYVQTLREHNPLEFLKVTRNRRAMERWIGVGYGTAYQEIHRFLQRVELDEHEIDAIFTLEYLDINGTWKAEVLSRIWLIVLIDCMSRAILGYYLSYNFQTTGADILRCILRSLRPFPPPAPKSPGLSPYYDMALPVVVMPELSWMAWDELAADRALCHRHNDVKRVLMESMGCRLDIAKPHMPEAHAIVERLFRDLESRGYHNLPSTTGNSPDDPRRNAPEKQAKRFRINREVLVQLTHSIVAEHNHSVVDAIGTTPINYIKNHQRRGELLRKLPPNAQDERMIIGIRYRCTIIGNLEKGERAYIQLNNLRYSGDTLYRRAYMIGSSVIALLNPNDVRYLRLFHLNGAEIGSVQARGKFGIVAMTLEQLKDMFKKRTQVEMQRAGFSFDPEGYFSYHCAIAGKSKKARSVLASKDAMSTEWGTEDANTSQVKAYEPETSGDQRQNELQYSWKGIGE